MTTVGEMVGYLRIDTSQWDRDAEKAKAKIEELGRKSPTIKVQADTAVALAKLDAVRGAILKQQAAELALSEAQAKHGATSRQAMSAESALINARGAATRAAIDAAKAEHTLADETDRGAKLNFTFRQNIVALAAFMGQTLAPVLAAAVGGLIALGPAGLVAILAFQGIHDALKKGGPVAQEFATTLATLKSEFVTLKETAAANVLGGLTDGMKSLLPAFDFVNQQVANFGVILGKVIANVLPGLVAMLHQAVPLFNLGGQYLLTWASGFNRWATTSSSFSQFVNYAIKNIPVVLNVIGDLVKALLRIIEATGPFGGVVLHALDAFAKLINAIPIGILQVVVPLIINLNAAMKALGIVQKVSDGMVAFAAALHLVADGEVSATVAAKALWVAYSPVAAAVAATVALGLSVEKVSHLIANVLTGGPQQGQTPKSLDWLGDARHKVLDLGKSLLGIGGSSHTAAAAMGTVQTAAVTLLGAQTKAGLVIDGVTYSMDKQNTAATILRAALDKLNGASVSVEQSQNSFYDSLSQLQKRTASYNGTLNVLNDTGRKNRETIVSALQAANDHAQAMVDEKLKTEGASAALRDGVKDFKQHETAIRSAAAAARLDKTQVNNLINEIGKVPSLKVAKIDVHMSGQDQVAILKQNLAALKSRQIDVTTYVQNVILPTLGTASVTHDSRHAAGGLINGPGTGTSDSVFARLSNGEFVMNANATAQFLPMLQAMNNAVPAFAGGGAVNVRPQANTVLYQPVVQVNIQGSVHSNKEIAEVVRHEFDMQRRWKGDVGILDSWSGQKAQQMSPIATKTVNTPGFM